MKRNVCFAALAVCVAAGAGRFWDLIANSELNGSGFVTLGSVWVRYGVLALIVVGLFVLGKTARAKQSLESVELPMPPLTAVLAVCALCSGALGTAYAVEQFTNPTTSLGHAEAGAAVLLFAFVLRFLFAVSMVLFGVWCVMLCLRRKPLQPQKGWTRTLGFFGVVAFCILPLIRYAENPASVYRILRILPICSALAAMWFVVRLLGTLCVTFTPARRGQLAAAGLCAFLMCTCVEAPQILWQMQTTGISLAELWTGATLALLGCLGATTALAVSGD